MKVVRMGGYVGLPSDLAASHVIMVACDTAGVLLHMSDAYCEFVGRRREELVGRRAEETGVAGSSDRVRWILERVPEAGQGVTYRRTFETPTGARICDVHLHRLADDLIVTTVLPVNAEKAEDDRDAVLSSFMDAVPLGLVVYDREFRIVRINRAVEAMGRVRPEHFGQRITDAFADVDPAVLDSIRSVLEGGDEIVNQQLTRPDGHELLLHFFPIRDRHGVSQVGCLFNDVTALTRAQRLIFAQRLTIKELSTPILELDVGLVVLPLIGMVDSERAMEITERLLHAIKELRGRMVVIDVTGVPVVDSAAAHHLSKTVQAARLMGATTLISGISAESALALARLGVDLGEISTAGTLRDAVNELRGRTTRRGSEIGPSRAPSAVRERPKPAHLIPQIGEAAGRAAE